MKLEKRRYAGASVDRTNPAATLIHIVSGPGCLWKMRAVCGKWAWEVQGSAANLLSKFNYEKL
jgi:hypothetical protein